MTKKEQIEDMAKERNEIKDIMKLLDKCVSLNPMCKSEVATVVYGNNYRKLPDGAVVLLIGENNQALDEKTIEYFVKHNEQIRKETAKEILDYFDKYAGTGKKLIGNMINEQRKKYGVEVEE